MYVLLNTWLQSGEVKISFFSKCWCRSVQTDSCKGYGLSNYMERKNQFTIRTHFIQEILILPKPTQNIFYWCSKNLFCGISEKTWCEERLTLFTPSLTATMLFLFVFTGALSKWESCFLFTNKIQLQPINQFS